MKGRSEAGLDMEAMQKNAGAAAQLLKTLANEQRLRILCHLIGGELSVGQINEQLELSQSALSQHLAKLREEGIVTTRREAQTIYYSVSEGAVREIMRTLHRIYCEIPGRRRR
jgi:DNA-binding transcriptional ArsR family regulator